MKPHALGAVGLATLVWLVASPTESATRLDDAIFAICRAEARVDTTGSVPTVSIESGMGDGGFPIATASKTSQAWFDYGIKLYHAFYHDDAKRAFDKAVAAWPSDPLALLVLFRANDGLGRHDDARRADAQAIGLWRGDIAKVNVATI